MNLQWPTREVAALHHFPLRCYARRGLLRNDLYNADESAVAQRLFQWQEHIICHLGER